MVSNKDLLEHLMDMKADIREVKTTLSDYPALKAEVIKHDRSIREAKTSLKVLRWGIGIMFVGVPSAAYGIMKLLA